MTPTLLLIQIVAALGGLSGIAAALSALRERRALKRRAPIDAVTELSAAAIELLEPTREQVQYLRGELLDRDHRLGKAESEIRTLRRLMLELEDRVQRLRNELEIARMGKH